MKNGNSQMENEITVKILPHCITTPVHHIFQAIDFNDSEGLARSVELFNFEKLIEKRTTNFPFVAHLETKGILHFPRQSRSDGTKFDASDFLLFPALIEHQKEIVARFNDPADTTLPAQIS